MATHPVCPKCSYPLLGLRCENCGWFYVEPKKKEKKKRQVVN